MVLVRAARPQQSFDVKGDSLSNFRFRLFDAGACCDAAWKVRHIGGIIAACVLNHHCVFHFSSAFKPACFNMLLNVPGAKSSDGFPAIVARLVQPEASSAPHCRELLSELASEKLY